MDLFRCGGCGAAVFFENSVCATCGRALAFAPDVERMCTLEPDRERPSLLVSITGGGSRRHGEREPRLYRMCSNALAFGTCNWAIPDADPTPLCLSCRLNEAVPDPSDDADRAVWARIEGAKRRLLYSLLRLHLPLRTRAEDPARGLAFAFVKGEEGSPATTGHANGVITLNLAEADAPFRERIRAELGEAYRTLLGHFRHEIGHYYWSVLVEGTDELPLVRSEFGDETRDYAEALASHYGGGREPGWQARFVSAYASSHPWEDWAETWAHYLHMIDTLDTARSHGVVLAPARAAPGDGGRVSAKSVDFEDFDDLLSAWIPLTVALNDLSRSMGHPDTYPFVLTGPVTRKLRFVHELVERSAA